MGIGATEAPRRQPTGALNFHRENGKTQASQAPRATTMHSLSPRKNCRLYCFMTVLFPRLIPAIFCWSQLGQRHQSELNRCASGGLCENRQSDL